MENGSWENERRGKKDGGGMPVKSGQKNCTFLLQSEE